MDFEKEFKRLAGFEPMKWQTRLYNEYFVKGRIPASLDIPTGLGKTSVMSIWYLAQKSGAALPRRLVYVVDRRAVVDQATGEAVKIKESSGDGDLRISTLRGQYVDNRKWLEDPGKPAIIVGTVDMIGSRILFSGYGVSRKMRPYHAGLLGADALVVLDESHLVPPFERLLEAVEIGTEKFGPISDERCRLVPPFKLLSLSATGLQRNGECFQLDETKGDLDDAIVKERLGAKKCLTIESTNGKKLEEVLADHAWTLSGKGRQATRILVYCNSREVAEKVKQGIDEKAKQARVTVETELFVGARRVKERVDAAEKLAKLGFLASSEVGPDKSAFLVATSAGEVGVDLDADHMVCDLVEWERMVQRFGRVNRKGGQDRQAKIHVVAIEPNRPCIEKPKPPPVKPPRKPDKPGRLRKNADERERAAHVERKVQYKIALKNYETEKKKFDKAVKDNPEKQRKYDEAWKEYRAFQAKHVAIELLVGDASPAKLRELKRCAAIDSALQKKFDAAMSPSLLYPALTRALVDAWAMTSLEKHTGRPEIVPWLRGWVDDDKSQTALVWRRYLPVRAQGPEALKKEIETFFEAAQPHLSEKLKTETWRVLIWLEKRAIALAKQDEMQTNSIIAFALNSDGSLRNKESLRLRDFFKIEDKAREKKRKETLEQVLAGATLIVGVTLGGLKDGLLNPDAACEGLRTADDGDSWPADIGFEISAVASNEAFDRIARVTFSFATKQSAEGETIERLLIGTKATENSRAVSTNPQLLEEHQSYAEGCARKIAEAVGLKGAYAEVIAIAARLHDEGKKAARWQHAFNVPHNGGIYAKTKGPLIQARLGGYRHEFGSIPYAEKHPPLKQFPEDLQDLALHLIAAHHGRARPIIGTQGCDDAPPSLLEARARDIALRFARLQGQWGPWGLAWWEALMRAADQQASRDNDKRGDPNG
jgi:CRISPR-associated endonuclease/helicase Cas3